MTITGSKTKIGMRGREVVYYALEQMKSGGSMIKFAQ